MYEIEQLVRLAKRENNNKRPYLYVNPLQGKHIPVQPGQMKEMCRALAGEIGERYGEEKLFIIGFAETATAIAAYVACCLENAVYYENTTREEIEDAEYLYFTESHSHATDQKLNAKWFEGYLCMSDRIVFVEDEVTTGNTICKLIDEIGRKFPGGRMKYTIASVLNSMAEERVTELHHKGIDCIWLKKIPFEYKIESIGRFTDSNACMHDCTGCSCGEPVHIVKVPNGRNPRSACKADDYVKAVRHLCEFIYDNESANQIPRSRLTDYQACCAEGGGAVGSGGNGPMDAGASPLPVARGEKSGNSQYGSVLVLGTEECMYPAIEAAGYLQEKALCKTAKTHSTTRSPIMAYSEKDYPLKIRHKLLSLYDEERVTYIYNLEKYDKVIIVTDAKLTSPKGLQSLIYALGTVGNDNISVYQWTLRQNKEIYSREQ